jgi:HK97 family phage major capsid protein
MTLNERIMELRRRRAAAAELATAVALRAEKEDRALNAAEQAEYDAALGEATKLEQRESLLMTLPPSVPSGEPQAGRSAPAVIAKRGDNEAQALAAFFRGDLNAAAGLLQTDERGNRSLEVPLPRYERRADGVINVGTGADGGFAVPTGFAGQIAARKAEMMLAPQLGLRQVPGKGTTVNFPFENSTEPVLSTVAEQDDGLSNTYPRRKVVLGNKAFTLVKKPVKLHVTEETLEDEDANLMAYISDWLGRQMALTHNGMLVTEILTNGTALAPFASATAIAAGELENLVYDNSVAYYLDDGGSPAWIMRPATFGAIAKLTGSSRFYVNAEMGNRSLLGYRVAWSNQAPAIGTTNKSVIFGDMYQVGWREGDSVSFLVDPYSVDGVTVIKASFRACYGVLQPAAVGYATHA